MSWITGIVLGQARERNVSASEIKMQATTLEDAMAYSSFLSSGVAGVEEISFEEFLRRAKKRKTTLFT
ncbi:MAG TPA: hypothetical protein VFH21_00250 [Burkholderiales bacterium]|nr:hypothetical protein [Burkholderiales bacterium]